MIFVNSPAELDFNNNPNGVWGCYSDPLFQPKDILLQVNGIDLSETDMSQVHVLVCTVGGTVVEDGTSFFNAFIGYFTLNGTTYYYVNFQCGNYSPYMLSNGCFTLQILIDAPAGSPPGAPPLFNGFTQKYNIINDIIVAGDVTITGGCSLTNLATLCNSPVLDGTCGKPYVKFNAVFDCIDTFTGDYYGDPSGVIGGIGLFPFDFIRQSWIEGRLKKLPRAIKRTISINGRTQRTETTPKYQLQGVVPFPVWKMEELENMLLANHLYADGIEYQSDGGTPFAQFGKPQNSNYVYKMEMDLQDLYEWQVFGCTPVCVSQTYYYPIPF